ncbi:DNA-directed RNA polymerase subunit beta [Mycoplasmopsis californica]|uniref:DNA-directed RNA polymerase subunit beta n=3 Tax=Mycoplasmopsis equigenitalium TaxID=114883 RepID=A0ABY5J0L6_9BACT|nr:DNA-directed RNA polymerase subunit beta [Mycoplasmopsis equigenitalium]UUD36769.1 DNA-directed RNA polymerase subunit beta [Mycoplasmopsis equigenitalium]VEU69933.1 DNA-directed RNA polymerase subunit beta [Mycoplasmopsis californica]
MASTQKAKEYREVRFSKHTVRRDYSVTKKTLPITSFLDIQKKSFEKFKTEGIEATFREHYPITASIKKVTIEYIHNSAELELPGEESMKVREAKQKGTTYGAKLYARLRKLSDETGETKEERVLFGEIPLMTKGASFIINGSEKIIVSQLIRSSGVYFGVNVRNKQSDDLFNKVELLPQLGSWLEFSHRVTSNTNDSVKVKIDKNKNITLPTFLGSFGMRVDTMRHLFGKSEVLEETIKKDKLNNDHTLKLETEKVRNDCLEAIYQVIRKGDRLSEDGVKSLIASMFFNKKRYSLSKTGRYMFNRKLNFVDRITDTYLGQDIWTFNEDGTKDQKVYDKGMYIKKSTALKIQKLYDTGAIPLEQIPDIDESVYHKFLKEDPNLATRTKMGTILIYPTKKWMSLKKEPVLVISNDPTSDENHLLISDIIAAIGYYFNLLDDVGNDDDPDSLMNKRIVSVGELLQNELNVGFAKMEKNTRERLSAKELEKITPKNVTNNKLVFNQIKQFFNSSKLSQFMDQINPLAELSSKRRLTSLGPGGLNRDTAQFEVRDVHPTHYGRICPIETPEGPNIGLILNLASHARVNELGFLETPYFRVNDGVVDYNDVCYLSAAEETGHIFIQSSTKVNENNEIADDFVVARYNGDYIQVPKTEVEFIDVDSKQMTSLAASAIPFLENDDANRALMGSNMQRQAVPLLISEAPLVGTGIEADIAKFSYSNVVCERAGEVVYVDGNRIEIKTEEDKKNKKGHVDKYYLRVFERSNQASLIHQKPVVKLGDFVEEGEIIADGSSCSEGELSLGKNVIVAFSTLNGYNYEDAVILSERLVKDDVYTSIHIEEQTIQFRNSKAGNDILTTDIPNTSTASKRHLDANGIVTIGSEVQPGDILVGRVSPKADDNPTPEEKLLSALFSKKQANTRDTSLKVKNGHSGTIIDTEVLSRENGDVLEDGVEKIVKVWIAQKRKIKVGDKMAGRHGNKGVISIVLPVEDMPYMADGTPVDIVLNPQGVPSRMNIGQVLELHLGLAAKKLGVKFATPVFDGINKDQIFAALKEAGLPENGKMTLYDGVTGEPFDKQISVGIMYMLKLSHMVDDKMHARSIGPYSLITQQPLGGKSQNGGQRFGEMETWAVESYGAANVLQELLTYKSDNITGRNALYSALATGKPMPKAGTPESFNVLAYELRGLGIKLEVHRDNVAPEEDKMTESNKEINRDDTRLGGR